MEATSSTVTPMPTTSPRGICGHVRTLTTQALAALLVVAALTGCSVSGARVSAPQAPASSISASVPSTASPSIVAPPASTPVASPSSTPSGDPGDLTALEALEALEVKGRAPMTGYDHDRFGQAWLDADRNGCDTRNDILARDLVEVSFKSGTGECAVESGTLYDAYTGTTIAFVYGDGTLVDIDHVVALGNVWVTGGFAWPIHQRAAIANDPMNLLAVDASANRQKGDGDTATWLPSNKAYRCAYVARQVSVKVKYSLWVTAPEREAMVRVLSSCPAEPVVEDSGAALRVDQNLTDPGAPTSSPNQPSGATGSGEVYYANCDAARAAGAAPVRTGDPGYGPHLDGDGDGIACE